MAVLWVNDLAVATPSELRTELVEVGSGERRSVSGRLVEDVTAVKRRLHLKWAVLDTKHMGALLGAVAEPFFTVTCPDPAEGSRTMVCRCGGRAAGVLKMVGGEPVWTDVGMVWTER